MFDAKNGSAKNRISEKPIEAEGEDMRALAYLDELPADLVAQDFVARGARVGSNRREFLLDYCKEERVQDYET